jgi:signal transduction protein with GAF and PtsI domain
VNIVELASGMSHAGRFLDLAGAIEMPEAGDYVTVVMPLLNDDQVIVDSSRNECHTSLSICAKMASRLQ